MSILAEAVETVSTTAPSIQTPHPALQAVVNVVLIGIVVAAVALAWYVGVFRRDGIKGPTRAPANVSLWPLAISLIIAVVIWIGGQTVYVGVRAVEFTQAYRANNPQATDIPRMTAADFTAGDFAFLSTVPGLLALGAIVIADFVVNRKWFTWLGWSFKDMPRGIRTGIIASLITLPIVFFSTFLLDIIYRWIEFKHPEAHELLNALGSTRNVLFRVAMIGGAAIVAPLWEEVAFRGHLQTLMAAGMNRLFGPWHTPEPVIVSPELVPLPPATSESVPILHATSVVAVAVGPTVRQRWLSVLLTSALFASVHEMWTWPAIFLLAVCLGFAYERTGNLWTSIFLHLAFNSLSTFIFLSQSL